jgi:hypothetical protein
MRQTKAEKKKELLQQTTKDENVELEFTHLGIWQQINKP